MLADTPPELAIGIHADDAALLPRLHLAQTYPPHTVLQIDFDFLY